MAILTGSMIKTMIQDKLITIDPYQEDAVGPNSVDLRLDSKALVYDPKQGLLNSRSTAPRTIPFEIGPQGYKFEPGTLYLVQTMEVIGSETFVPMVSGRSSTGRLGVSVHQTAGICDTGFKGRLTLEISVVHPVVMFPGDRICQVLFFDTLGDAEGYTGKYQGAMVPMPSKGLL